MNNTTRTTQWNWPDDVPKPELDVEDIRHAKDPSSGKIYYAEGDKTTWEVPPEIVAAHVSALNEPVSPKPGAAPAAAAAVAAAAARPAAAAAAASGAGGGGAAGEPRDTSVFGFTATMKSAWLEIMRLAKDEAEIVISTRNAKFDRLRKFKKKQVARRRAERDRKAEEAAVLAAEAAEDAAIEAAEGRRTMMDLLEVEIPDAPSEKKSMEEYATTYLQLNRKGIFKSATTVDKLLTFKNALISMALHDFGTAASDLTSSATQMWKNVLAFIGERRTGKEGGGHAEKIVKVALHAPEELRDEVYVQLIKACTGNPSVESTMRAWGLIGVITGAFGPSGTLQPYFESFCYGAMTSNPPSDTGEPGVHEFARFVLGRVAKVVKLGPRREIPTAAEIGACSSLLPVVVRVDMLDGSFEFGAATSWTTPVDLKIQMCDLMGIAEPNRECFAIYEMTPELEERYLEPDERILDLVSYWQRLHDEMEKKSESHSGGRTYRLVLKVHLYHDVVPNPDTRKHDEAAEKLMWVQACYDIVSARYPAGEDHCLDLGALNRQAETPRTPPTEEVLARYLPAKLATGTRKKEMAVELTKRMEAHSSKTPIECRKEVMEIVRRWKVYGSSFFFVVPHMNSTLPDEVFLAVNPQGILLIDPTSKKVVSQYAYSEIPTWGHSGSSFVLHVGNLLKQTKLYFQTEMGAEINQLVRAYIARSISNSSTGVAAATA